jgi:hypothetical protein
VRECKECQINEDEGYLYKCPICHLEVCEEHTYMRSGRNFCSVHCADSFFHGDDDEDEMVEE